jgi:hypothetical protein
MQAMAAQVAGAERGAPLDTKPWHELQNWLDNNGEHQVVIPYAEELARAIPPVAVRLRRDFGAVLRLIKTHAILHQCQRGRDEQGRIVATMKDYADRAHLPMVRAPLHPADRRQAAAVLSRCLSAGI